MLSPLRKARLLKELTIYDVRQMTGLDTAKLSLIERGYKEPSPDERGKLARALSVRVEEIFPKAKKRGGGWPEVGGIEMESRPSTQEKFLNEKETSELTGFALSTLRNWRFRRQGPPYRKFGSRCIRYSLSDVIAFMDSHKIEPDNND